MGMSALVLGHQSKAWGNGLCKLDTKTTILVCGLANCCPVSSSINWSSVWATCPTMCNCSQGTSIQPVNWWQSPKNSRTLKLFKGVIITQNQVPIYIKFWMHLENAENNYLHNQLVTPKDALVFYRQEHIHHACWANSQTISWWYNSIQWSHSGANLCWNNNVPNQNVSEIHIKGVTPRSWSIFLSFC